MGRDEAETPVHTAEAEFQSTLPAWGETYRRSPRKLRKRISIHSPRMGRDQRRPKLARRSRSFQSTLPAWGETAGGRGGVSVPSDFNPLSPHGERPIFDFFQIFLKTFQSTLPAWGETPSGSIPSYGDLISIHSPRMGRDWMTMAESASVGFQSTLPAWGET